MAAPTQPTIGLISTEAFRKFGISVPSAAQITDASTELLEDVKSDLNDMGIQWDFLRNTAYRTLTKYNTKIQLPTDFKKLMLENSVRLLDGDTTGTAQAGGATSITLISTDSSTAAGIRGKEIVITGGTGVDQVNRITALDTGTKVATVADTWTTNPDSTSTYMIIDQEYDVTVHPMYERDYINIPSTEGRPQNAFIEGDAAEGDLVFDRSPDKAYPIRIRYYQDILDLDITATKYDRILKLLRGLFVQGIFALLCQDDQRKAIEEQKYARKLLATKMRYLYPHNVENQRPQVEYE